MEFLRPVGLSWLARTSIKRIVTCEGLSRAGGGEHRKEKREVLHFWKDLFNAHQRDVRPWQGARQAGVSLVLRDGDHPGFGDGKVCSADAHVRGEIFAPQHAAGDDHEFLGAVGRLRAKFPFEQIADFPAEEMHCGENEMVGASCRSCTMYSPKSLSTTASPALSKASLR